MHGILYGVGVGPGDPRLMTFLAADTIKKCEVLAVPARTRELAVSYQIARGLLPELDQKACLSLAVPMTKDRKVLNAAYEQAADLVEEQLKAGKDVACLTLGDPTIYSTYIYLHRIIKARGYETQIISGIPSFCAVSARLGDSLADRSEQLHIVPSAYGVEETLSLSGTKVLMKAASKMDTVKKTLLEQKAGAVMVENCGMENEMIFRGTEQIPDQAGYYSIIVVKEQQKW